MGPQEEEEDNYDHVCDGLQILSIEGCGHSSQPAQDLYCYWFDPGRRGVLTGVAAEL